MCFISLKYQLVAHNKCLFHGNGITGLTVKVLLDAILVSLRFLKILGGL